MNCQGIARVLDDGRIDALTAPQLEEIKGHLATCAECAGDWEIDARIRAAVIPSVSARLLSWHPGRSSERSLPKSAPRRRARLIVIPLLLLAGAAAAVLMLGSMLELPIGAGSTVDVVDRSTDSATPVVEISAGTVDAPAPAAVEAETSVVRADAQRYRLVVLGPVHSVQTVEAIQGSEGVHRGLVRFFRSRSDLEVVEVTASELAAIEAELGVENTSNWSTRDRAIARRLDSPFSVRVQTRFMREPDLWTIDVLHEYERDGGVGGGSTGFQPCCERRENMDPDVVGAELAQHIYGRLLPDSGVEQFLSVVLDSGRSASDRLGALEAALNVREFRRYDRRGNVTPAAVQAAIELGRTGADAVTRRRAWELLAQTGQPSVTQPLTDALLYDPDAEVRAAAAEGLADYLESSAVRAALDTASITDPSPNVRLRARWSSLTNENRSVLVKTMLLDSSMTLDERIAPLVYARANRHRIGVSTSELLNAEIPAIDGEALDVVGELAKSSVDPIARGAALREFGLGGHPAFVSLFKAERDDELRNAVVADLLNRRSRPGVQAQLERLRHALDPDDRARRTLERVLTPPRAPSDRGNPPSVRTR